MTLLVLGSKPLDEPLPSSISEAYVANGAFSQLILSGIVPDSTIGVFTPYLFSPSEKEGPYQERTNLRQSALRYINEFRPERVVVRPTTRFSQEQVRVMVARALSYEPRFVEVPSRLSISWNLLRSAGHGPVVSAYTVARARAVGLSPIQDPRWKISTGLVGLVLAMQSDLARNLPIVLAGIGVDSAPYPESPEFLADRGPHIGADIGFLRDVRRLRTDISIKILDPQLNELTDPKISRAGRQL